MDKCYVIMTDKFMSGWGEAKGKINKYVIECDNVEQADLIAKNAANRSDMRNITTSNKVPYYSPSRYLVTMKTFAELGAKWKE